jgi:CheY-like chemotaxis protein
VSNRERKEKKKMKILVVDDQRDIGKILKELLESFGDEVVLCESGDQAVQNIGFADAIITDFIMPGKNGVELAKAARLQKPNISILLMTGNINKVPREHFADRVIEKPFGLTEIIEWLHEITK